MFFKSFVKQSVPDYFFLEGLLVIESISSIDIGLLKLCMFPCMLFGSMSPSHNWSILSKISNLWILCCV